jgi:hypothetical protein
VTTLDNAGPLLETKLYVPRLRRGLVARPRLSERLSRGAESKLTLISAPAGFGKTTLLAEWMATAPARERPTAWLSLDPSDNEAASFWTYLITALQTVAPGVGASALSLLQAPRPPPIEAVLATLLNEIGLVPDDIVPRGMSPRWRRAPKAGSQPSSRRRSRSRAETTSPASSPASPGTTATSWTAWSKRFCTVNPNMSGASCCRHPSLTG